MRNLFYLFFAVMTAFIPVSCAVDIESIPIDGEKTVVTIGVESTGGLLQTKASDLVPTPSENAYSSGSVLVFRKSTGALVSSSPWNGADVSFALDIDTYKVYALLNASSFVSSVKKESDISSYVRKLSDESGGFFMMGSTEMTVSATGGKFKVIVNRVVSKVVLKEVKVSMDASYASSSFKLVDAFMINVAGDCKPSEESYSPTLWYNKMIHSDSSLDRFLYAGGIEASIPNKGSKMIDRTFYIFPNATTSDAHGGSWSARKTRLVLHAKVDGEDCYYPLTLASVGRNKVYTIRSLTITRRGISTPDGIWVSEDGKGSVEIGGWTEGGDISESM